uniref:Partner of Y14 and mago n=1 Tax=Parascaris univalens TaxID=6257 RepID=A0A915CCN8_PARUN
MTPKETTPHKARTRPTKPTVAFEKPNAPITPRDHMEKKIGNLNRKLRDIDILQARMRASIISKRRKRLKFIRCISHINDILINFFAEYICGTDIWGREFVFSEFT